MSSTAQNSSHIARWEGTNHGSQISENFGTVTNHFNTLGNHAKCSLIPTCNVPFRRDIDFVCRADLLEELAERFAQPASRVALVGIGGVGKSQLAIEFCYRLHGDSPDTWIFWVYAGNIARLQQSFRDIASHAQILDHEDSYEDVFKLVSRWLRNEKNGKWLLVLDSLDESLTLPSEWNTATKEAPSAGKNAQTSLLSYLPQTAHGRILITSRRKDVAAGFVESGEIVLVESMSECEAVELFTKKLHPGEEITPAIYGELVSLLEYMPLALVQAATYIRQRHPRVSVPQYVTEFQQSEHQGSKLLTFEAGNLRRDEAAKNSVITTWQISFDYIRMQRKSAANLLSVMCFFDGRFISERLLRMRKHRDCYDCELISDDRFGLCGDNDDDSFEDDLNMLRNFSLVSIGKDNMTFMMHRLVRLALRVWLEQQSQIERYYSVFLRKLRIAFVCSYVEGLPHVAETAELLYHTTPTRIREQQLDDETTIDWARVMADAAYTTAFLGNMKEAQRVAHLSDMVMQEVLGPTAELTLIYANTLARTYLIAHRYDEAEELLLRTKQLLIQEFGEDHIGVLRASQTLVEIYKGPQHLDKRLELLKQVHSIQERLSSEDLTASARTLSQIIQIHNEHPDAAVAMEVASDALSRAREAFGDNHSITLQYMADLATIHSTQGRCDEAEELYVDSMNISEESSEKNPAQYLRCLSKLANFYEGKDRLSEAEVLATRALTFAETIFGDDPLFKYQQVLDLSSIYQKQGRWYMAAEIGARSLASYRKVFGANCRYTGYMMLKLASLRFRDHRLYEAEELYVQSLSFFTESFGEESHLTLVIMTSLVSIYFKQQLYQKALDLQSRVLKIVKKTRGEEHRDLIDILISYYRILSEQGRHDEAIEAQIEVVWICCKVFGDHDRRTLMNADLLSQYCFKHESFIMMLTIQKCLTGTLRQLSGNDHPNTLKAMYNLSLVLYKLHQHVRAMGLVADCLELSRKVLGVDDPLTCHCIDLERLVSDKLAAKYERLKRGDVPEMDEGID